MKLKIKIGILAVLACLMFACANDDNKTSTSEKNTSSDTSEVITTTAKGTSTSTNNVTTATPTSTVTSTPTTSGNIESGQITLPWI